MGRRESILSSLSSISNLPKLSDTDLLLVLDGDSLTHGSGAGKLQNISLFLEAYLTPLCKSFEIQSFGVSGQTTQDMLLDAVTQIDPLVNPAKTCVYYHWEDVNAILNVNGAGIGHGVTPQQNYDDHETLASGRKTAGYDYVVYATGYYPRTPYNDPAWDVGNPSPLDFQKEFFDLGKVPSADVLVDFRLNVDIGGVEGQAQDPLLFSDGVHLLNDGYEKLATNAVGSYLWAVFRLFQL